MHPTTICLVLVKNISVENIFEETSKNLRLHMNLVNQIDSNNDVLNTFAQNLISVPFKPKRYLDKNHVIFMMILPLSKPIAINIFCAGMLL